MVEVSSSKGRSEVSSSSPQTPTMAKRQKTKQAPKPTGPKAVRRKDASVSKMDTYESTLEQGGEDACECRAFNFLPLVAALHLATWPPAMSHELQHELSFLLSLTTPFLYPFVAVQTNRDRILLDDTSNQARRTASDDEFDDEEEVFAHRNLPGSDDDEEEEQYDDEPAAKPKRKERKLKPLPSTEPKGRFAKPARSASPDSDASDEDDDAAEGSGSASGSGSEDETWGTNANAYYARPSTRRGRDDEEGSGDEDLEERREMEDREARKLQRKGREAMSGGDFGLEDLSREAGVVEDEEVAR